jgi:hypothetical protein
MSFPRQRESRFLHHEAHGEHEDSTKNSSRQRFFIRRSTLMNADSGYAIPAKAGIHFLFLHAETQGRRGFRPTTSNQQLFSSSADFADFADLRLATDNRELTTDREPPMNADKRR